MKSGIIFSNKRKMSERIESLEAELSQLRMEFSIENEKHKVADLDQLELLKKHETLNREIACIYDKMKENNDEIYSFIEQTSKANQVFFENFNNRYKLEKSEIAGEIDNIYNAIQENNNEIFSYIEKMSKANQSLYESMNKRFEASSLEVANEFDNIYKTFQRNNDEIYKFIENVSKINQERVSEMVKQFGDRETGNVTSKEQWQVMFSYDNMLADLQLSLIEQLVPGNRERLEQLKDSHLGEKCFVIGNGPSLTADDLSMLKEKGIFTFASKRINVIFDQTDWRPDIWAASDLPYIEMYQNEISNLSGFPKLLPAQIILKRGIQIKDAIYFPFLQSERNPQWFNYDILRGIHFWGTITCKLINLAVYMGFKEIYLLGVDNTYPLKLGEDGKYQIDETKQDHFSKDYATEEQKKVLNKDIDDMVHAMEYVQSSFKTVKWFCEQKGINVYNATRGGKLEVFPRVKFENII